TVHTRPMLRLNPHNSISRPTTSLTAASVAQSTPVLTWPTTPVSGHARCELARDPPQQLPGGARRQRLERNERTGGLVPRERAYALAGAGGADGVGGALRGPTVARANGVDVGRERRLGDERANERQRELALGEIAEEGLAGRARIARVVEDIVDELERHAEVRPVIAERARRLGRSARDRRAGPCGPREERRGLVVNNPKVDLFTGVEDHPAAELNDLAIDESTKGREEIREYRPRRRRGRALERVGEEQVASQDADRVSPDAARGGLSAPLLPVVDPVVVEGGRQVDEPRHDRQLPRRGGRGTKTGGRQEDRQRPDPLSARLEEVGRGLRRRREPIAHDARQLAVDQRHVGAEEGMDLGQAIDDSTAGAFGDVVQQPDGNGWGVRRDVKNYLKVLRQRR